MTLTHLHALYAVNYCLFSSLIISNTSWPSCLSSTHLHALYAVWNVVILAYLRVLGWLRTLFTIISGEISRKCFPLVAGVKHWFWYFIVFGWLEKSDIAYSDRTDILVILSILLGWIGMILHILIDLISKYWIWSFYRFCLVGLVWYCIVWFI